LTNLASTGFGTNQSLAPLHAKWGWIVTLGVVYLVAGIIALGSVFAATVASVFVVVIMMLIAGVAEVVNAFQVKSWGRFFFWLIFGILYIVAGFVAFENPLLTAVWLTLFLGAALVASGILRKPLSARACRIGMAPATGSLKRPCAQPATAAAPVCQNAIPCSRLRACKASAVFSAATTSPRSISRWDLKKSGRAIDGTWASSVARRVRASPRNASTSHGGSQRDFSLVKILLWAQCQSRKAIIRRMAVESLGMRGPI
jgi:Short repeat of unknown function (DUF308)